MKIVINKCYGGFSLSYAGCMEYAKLRGIKLYPFVEARKPDGMLDFHHHIPWDGKGKEPFLVHYATAPLVDGTYEDKSYWSDRDLKRDDPALVKTIENLGQSASGECAKLKVVEIPDGVEYVIEEYDGIEWIAEKHKTWG